MEDKKKKEKEDNENKKPDLSRLEMKTPGWKCSIDSGPC